MGMKFAVLLLAIASIFAIATANKNCSNGTAGAANWNHTSPFGGFWGNWWRKNATDDNQGSRKIIVGGSENWHFAFNYSDWAVKNGPFYSHDTLVFKYDAPNAIQPFQHSVYLLPDLRSYLKCDFRRAKQIAGVNDGASEGYQFVLTLKKWDQPWYYFACGEHNGAHCRDGE